MQEPPQPTKSSKASKLGQPATRPQDSVSKLFHQISTPRNPFCPINTAILIAGIVTEFCGAGWSIVEATVSLLIRDWGQGSPLPGRKADRDAARDGQ